jgi:hypothetical protein
MITIEQVEKLQEKTGVSAETAREALEQAGGDLLDAVIILERKRAIPSPEAGGYFSSHEDSRHHHHHHDKSGTDAGAPNPSGKKGHGKSAPTDSVTFGELVGRFFRWCGRIIHKGNINNFDVIKDGRNILEIPVTVLVLLLCFAFWFVVPLIIVGLFFRISYRFSGPDLGRTQVNSAMNTVADATQKAVDTVVSAAENFTRDVKKGQADGTPTTSGEKSDSQENIPIS